MSTKIRHKVIVIDTICRVLSSRENQKIIGSSRRAANQEDCMRMSMALSNDRPTSGFERALRKERRAGGIIISTTETRNKAMSVGEERCRVGYEVHRGTRKFREK